MFIHFAMREVLKENNTICFSAISLAVGRGVETGLCKLGHFILQSDKLEIYDSLKNNA